MDVEIVNSVLRLCAEQQTCLFEVSILCDYCLEQQLCTSFKHVLPSIRNYSELFRISRDQTRIEFCMPFHICRQTNTIDTNASVHLCYEHFYRHTCQRLNKCPFPHVLSKAIHGAVLETLIHLDFDLLTAACRVYCQTKKHRSQSPLIRHANPPMDRQWLMKNIPQLSGTRSWKTKHRSASSLVETGLQISWTPQLDIQSHFIEVVFSNQNKCAGGPIRTHQIYQHLGVAHVFYQNSDTTNRVIHHGPVTFQSFTFVPHLLQRTFDRRRVCFMNMPADVTSYIEMVSLPYTTKQWDYYQEDRNLLVVEYNEDIVFSKISSNVRQHPECDGRMIRCRSLYQPESLLIEYDQECSSEDLQEWLGDETAVQIKTYSRCAFAHFNSHRDLRRAMQSLLTRPIRLIPIYTDLYSLHHLNEYLQRQLTSIENKTTFTSSRTDLSPKCHSSLSSSSAMNTHSEEPPIDEEEVVHVPVLDDGSSVTSEDDFHDLPSEFDDDDLFFDDKADHNGDVEFLRSAAKNLMSSLTEMEAASGSANLTDALQSMLYADDYMVTIKNRRFLLAFLDYTQFRVEKQRNPDRFRFLASLKRMTTQKQLSITDETPSPVSTVEVKSARKKRQRRTKKRKNTNTNEPDDSPEK